MKKISNPVDQILFLPPLAYMSNPERKKNNLKIAELA